MTWGETEPYNQADSVQRRFNFAVFRITLHVRQIVEMKHGASRPQKLLRLNRDGEVGGEGVGNFYI